MARKQTRQTTHLELMEQTLDAGAQDNVYSYEDTLRADGSTSYAALGKARDAYEINEGDNHYDAHRAAGTEDHDISEHCDLCRYCPETRGW